ncbi:ionotropic glutamate receptor [Lucifera butyrica]|uniref:Ionotropic glutamate receptor n=1 Tax=Lucifera butyrica TaxID=1351585 RepID=A0A498R3A1_9FIRM|nr:transporter substrate-binding domain-containing protein [Lucifera butyrica]VBB07126.1 ionotropic glutamate receptor [Lucifera butyrica]
MKSVSKKILVIASLLILIAATLAGCGAVTADKTASSDKGQTKKYVIACDAKYAPFSMEVNGKYKGIDVELLAAIAKAENINYELKPMDFSGIIPGLVSGQIDGAIAGMNITDERKKSVDFSDGYFKSGLAVIVSKDNTSIKSLADLNGKTAAVKKGTTGAKFAEDNKDKYHLHITYFDDSPSMMLAVANGNADFLMEDYPVINYQIKIGEQSKLKIAVPSVIDPPSYGFAVKKGENQELLKKFNEGLKKIKADGTYDKIVGEYISK